MIRYILIATTMMIIPVSDQSIAKPDEWITRPDGSRVCRLYLGLHVGMQTNPREWCSDWQETPPPYGAPCDSVSWCRIRFGRMQFLIGGDWRP